MRGYCVYADRSTQLREKKKEKEKKRKNNLTIFPNF